MTDLKCFDMDTTQLHLWSKQPQFTALKTLLHGLHGITWLHGIVNVAYWLNKFRNDSEEKLPSQNFFFTFKSLGNLIFKFIPNRNSIIFLLKNVNLSLIRKIKSGFNIAQISS